MECTTGTGYNFVWYFDIKILVLILNFVQDVSIRLACNVCHDYVIQSVLVYTVIYGHLQECFGGCCIM